MTNDNQQKNTPSAEDLVDVFINDLNQEQQLKPKKTTADTEEATAKVTYEISTKAIGGVSKDATEDVRELQAIAQILIKESSPIEGPSEDFIASLWQKLEPLEKGQEKTHELSPFYANNNLSRTPSPSPVKKKFLPWAGLVASILVFLFFFSTWSGSSQNIVLAMEDSVKN